MFPRGHSCGDKFCPMVTMIPSYSCADLHCLVTVIEYGEIVNAIESENKSFLATAVAQRNWLPKVCHTIGVII
jgi:hypothetical protein